MPKQTPPVEIDPGLTPVWVPLDDLLPDPNNARRHSESNLGAIRASLRRFGQRKPIVIDQQNIVCAGNGTLEAARAEGLDGLWAVVFPGTAEEARAYAIADNRTGELAHWDGAALLATLQGLDDELVAAAGYSADELTDLAERFNDAPDLDTLAAQLGEPKDDALWPTLRISVPKALLSRYMDAAEGTGESEPWQQLSALLDAAEQAEDR